MVHLMTLDRFYETLLLVIHLDSLFGLQSKLEQIRDNLANLVSSPATPQYQASLATNLADFTEHVAGMTKQVTPSQRSLLDEIGGGQFFDSSMASQISESVARNAMTPSVARDFVVDFASRRLDFIVTVSNTLEGLKKLNAHNRPARSSDADLAFLIPRPLFDNRLDSFARELRFISHLIEHFSEAVTGNVEAANLESLSSSIPTVEIAASIGVLTAIATAVDKFLSAWLKVEKIRRIRGELIEVGIKKQAVEELTEEITSIVDKVVEESRALIIENYKGEKNRRNELDNAIRSDLHRLFGQIERGLTVEFRTAPEEDAKPGHAESVKALKDISQKLVFPPMTNEPILLTNGDVIEDEITAAKVSEMKIGPTKPSRRIRDENS